MPERTARVPGDDELRWITTRAVAEIVPHQEFVDGLRSGEAMRIKMGFDPTKPLITLGWAVGLRKLRQLQDLGHTIVVIIGDWTARIGDPSGQSQTRQMLTAEEVQANADAILQQFYKILDESRTEIRCQSEWFDGFSLTDVVRFASRVTVARMLERDDFAQRFAAHKPIGLHELLYPLLQAYDSVAVEADVEFGGTDQKFNNLMGRELQRSLGQKAGPAGEGQAVFLVPLIAGTDGSLKMSQSLGNFIAVSDPPAEMFGKLMSIPDTLIVEYFETLTDVPEGELAHIRSVVEKGGVGARDEKMRLAREVVTQFHGEEDAAQAEEGFIRTFSQVVTPDPVKLKMTLPPPDLITEFRLSFSKSPSRRRWQGSFEKEPGPLHDISAIIYQAGLTDSISEARRLIQQGAVKQMTGEKVQGTGALLVDGAIIRVGKHRFLRIIDSDKHPGS